MYQKKTYIYWIINIQFKLNKFNKVSMTLMSFQIFIFTFLFEELDDEYPI